MALGPKRFKMEDIEPAIEDQVGFCTFCGAEKDGCEPDAEDYECDSCGAHGVYGAEQLIVLGKVD